MIIAKNKIIFPWLWVSFAKLSVNGKSSDWFSLEEELRSVAKNNPNGIIIKFVHSAITTPKVIINPKSMTGLIPLITKDMKATIVVNAVYKHGLNI